VHDDVSPTFLDLRTIPRSECWCQFSCRTLTPRFALKSPHFASRFWEHTCSSWFRQVRSNVHAYHYSCQVLMFTRVSTSRLPKLLCVHMNSLRGSPPSSTLPEEPPLLPYPRCPFCGRLHGRPKVPSCCLVHSQEA